MTPTAPYPTDLRFARFASALVEVRNPEIRGDLIEKVLLAVDKLNRGDVQRIVLAARRMACLYALLLAHGLQVDSPEMVVSDRFIDLLPDGAWAGERTVLLDDTRVTGWTMDRRIHSVERLVGSVELIEPIVCVELGGGAAQRIDALDLHNQFARAFGTNLLPFFTDFVVSQSREITTSVMEAILRSQEWDAVDVTNAVLAGTGARAFSLFPKDGFLNDYLQTVGVSAHLVEVAKIRVFVDTDRSSGNVKIRVVPIVLTKPLPAEAVQQWLREVRVERNSAPAQAEHGVGLAAILLSRALLAAFASVADTTFGVAIEEDTELSSLALGSQVSAIAGLSHVSTLTALVASAEDDSIPTEAFFDWPKTAVTSGQYILVGDDVARDPYSRLQTLKEDREAVVSMADLARDLKTNVVTASVAVDVLNDLGYCVPVFRTGADGRVRRFYRPGESARPYSALPIGRFGGRLASVRETAAIGDPAGNAGVELIRDY